MTARARTRRPTAGSALLVAALTATAAPAAPAAAAPPFGPEVLVTHTRGGAASTGVWPSLSAAGRYVAFTSSATGILPGPTGVSPQAYLEDTATRTTRLVSAAPDGTPADGFTFGAEVSSNGRFVVFESGAHNLVPLPADQPRVREVYRYDTASGAIRLVSQVGGRPLGSGGARGPSMSADGRYVVYETAASLVPADGGTDLDVYRYDARTRSTVLVSRAAGGATTTCCSSDASISSDGTRVTYSSTATNLVPGGTTGAANQYLTDLATSRTRLLSAGPAGRGGDDLSGGGRISADGRWVAFLSRAGDLLGQDVPDRLTAVYLYDVGAGRLRRISPFVNNAYLTLHGSAVSISSQGRYVVWSGDPGDLAVRRYDRVAGLTQVVAEQVSDIATASVSGDGRTVAFARTDGGLRLTRSP